MIIDLFAGPGGWSTGLNMLGLSETDGIEIDAAACSTAMAAGHPRLRADVREVDPRDHAERCTGLIASPPCQGFSMAGKGEGRHDSELILKAVSSCGGPLDAGSVIAAYRDLFADPRSELVLQPLKWALDLKPEWLAWEQVPAVLPIWAACAKTLRRHGWNVWTGLVDAEAYGVPQTRRRAILLAHRSREVAMPPATHRRYRDDSSDLPRWVSMAEALGWGMTHRPAFAVAVGTAAGGTDPSCLGGSGARIQFRAEREHGRWIEQPMDHPRRDPRPTPGLFDVEFAPSVNDGTRLTVAEAGQLQSFPADYPWRGRAGEQYQQAGDAMPPLLAAHCLTALGVGNAGSLEVAA